jgi:hypothetical protein
VQARRGTRDKLENGMGLRLALGVVGLVVGLSVASRAEEPMKSEPPSDAMADKPVSYKKDVAPLLKDACSSCHSGARAKAKLDVTNYDALMKHVKAGEPDKSKLHNALLGKDAKQMPPKNPLADDQIAIIKAWIAAGAKKD